MITDYGLEAQKTVDPRPRIFERGNITTLGFTYLAVGTGSTLPATNQVALANEIARTNSGGGFKESESVIVDTDTNKLIVSANLVRVIDFSASYNLTEFGFFTSSSGNNCVYRQLFRKNPNDPDSYPIVIPVQSGDQLRVSYTVSWIVPLGRHLTKAITTGGTAYTVNVGLVADPSFRLHPDTVFKAVHPYEDPDYTVLAFSTDDIDAAPTTKERRPTSQADGKRNRVAYDRGDYRVVKSVELSTAQLNGTFKSLVMLADGSDYALRSGIYFSFTPPITKTDLQTLTLSYTLSWGRA